MNPLAWSTGSFLFDCLIGLALAPLLFGAFYFVTAPIRRLSDHFDRLEGWRPALEEYRRRRAARHGP